MQRNLIMSSKPELVMFIEPDSKYRFRYESEQGSHGVLLGKGKRKGKKTYPTVQLLNYDGSERVIIRVSLCTEKRTKHVMVFKMKKSQEIQEYVDEELIDGSATFNNLTILSKKKEEIYQVLMDRRLENLGSNLSKCARKKFEEKYGEEIKKEVREISNSAILRFDAFEQNRPEVPLCSSLYSECICNQKDASKGDLRIYRLSHVSGTWRGGDEIILLCNRVQKDNIKVLFFENDGNGTRIWQEYGTFSHVDVHFQVAITFKTPRYRENAGKTISVCLDRQGEFSDAREFTYIPDYDDNPSKKRKKCVPDQTVELLSPINTTYPMSASSPGSSNTETSVDSLPEASEHQQSRSNVNSSDFPEIEAASNANYFDMYDPNLLKYLEDQCSDIFSELNFYDLEIENPFNNDNALCVPQSYGGDTLQMDIGVGQMSTLTVTEQNNVSADSVKQTFTKQHENVKTSKNNCHEMKKLSKYSQLMLRRDNSGNTLLHLAVLHNKILKTVMRMNQITKSDIINVQNNKRQTALHIAVEKNNSQVVQVLLRNSGNPNIKNAEGNNCYHIASKNNFDSCMNVILACREFYPEIDEFNYEGLTPLHIAIMKNSTRCYYLLRNYRANTKVPEKKSGRSLLHFAVEFQPSLVITLLEEEEIDINIQDFEGNTPLHVACAIGNFDIVEQLLLAGADPLLKNFKQSSLDVEEESSQDDDATRSQTSPIVTANLEESSEDDDGTCGQTPADITTNLEILEILRQAIKNNASNNDDAKQFSRSTETPDAMTNELCKLLDQDMRWRTVAMYFMDEKFVSSLECSPSPTRALLAYMKKTSGDQYIEEFKSVLEMADLSDAVQIIQGH